MKNILVLMLLGLTMAACQRHKKDSDALPQVPQENVLQGTLVSDRQSFDIDSKYFSTLSIQVDGKYLPFKRDDGRNVYYTLLQSIGADHFQLVLTHGAGLSYRIALD